MCGCMDQLLYGVDRHWGRFAFDRKQPLHSQDRFAMAMQQHRQPESEGRPVYRPIEYQCEGANVVAMPIGIMTMIEICIMRVAMIVDMIMVLFAPSVRTRSSFREGVCLDFEPALNLEGLALQVEQVIAEKVQWSKVLLGGKQERRRGV